MTWFFVLVPSIEISQYEMQYSVFFEGLLLF